MKRKPIKIKSYNRIYRRRNTPGKKALKIVGFAAIIAAVGFIGYSIAGPFLDFINGRIEPSIPEEPSQSISQSESLPDSSVEEPLEETLPLQAVTLLLETAKDPAALTAFLNTAKENGATGVILELKDVTGTLWYDSALETAAEYYAVSEEALAIDPIVSMIKEAELTPVAKLSAFMDRIAPNAARNNGYLYGDSSSAWWDNAVDKGGKPWLNPYKAAACDYLIAIQNELIGKGFEAILWHKVEFPEVQYFQSANMGPEAEGVTQQQALNNFIARAESEAEKNGAVAFVSYPVSAAFGRNESWFGGNPTGLKVKNAAPLLDLDSFGGSLTIGETAVDFSDTETALTQILSSYIAKANPERLLPVFADLTAADAAAGVLNTLQITEFATQS